MSVPSFSSASFATGAEFVVDGGATADVGETYVFPNLRSGTGIVAATVIVAALVLLSVLLIASVLAWVVAGVAANAALITTIGFILACTLCFMLAVRGLRAAEGKATASESRPRQRRTRVNVH